MKHPYLLKQPNARKRKLSVGTKAAAAARLFKNSRVFPDFVRGLRIRAVINDHVLLFELINSLAMCKATMAK